MRYTMKRTLSTLLCLLIALSAPVSALGEFVFSGQPSSENLLPPKPDSASQLDGGLLLTEKATASPSPSPSGKPTASPAPGSVAWQLLQDASASPSASAKAKGTLPPSALAGFMLSEWVLELPAFEGLLPSVEKGSIDYGAPLAEQPVYPDTLGGASDDPFAAYDGILGAGESATELTTYDATPSDPQGILLLPQEGPGEPSQPDTAGGLLLPGIAPDDGGVTEARPDANDILLPPDGSAAGAGLGGVPGEPVPEQDAQAGFAEDGAGSDEDAQANALLSGWADEVQAGAYLASALPGLTGRFVRWDVGNEDVAVFQLTWTHQSDIKSYVFVVDGEEVNWLNVESTYTGSHVVYVDNYGDSDGSVITVTGYDDALDTETGEVPDGAVPLYVGTVSVPVPAKGGTANALNLQASYVNGVVKLSWTPAADATYTVEKGDEELASDATNSYTDTAGVLTSSITYTVTENDVSVNTDSVTVSPTSHFEESLTITKSEGADAYALSWNDIAHATGYTVSEKVDAGDYDSPVAAVKPLSISYADLEAGKTYTYKIQATLTVGVDIFDEIELTKPAVTVNPPTAVQATIVDGKATVSWTASEGGADSYTIYRDGEAIEGTFTTSPYTDAGAKYLTAHKYKVAANKAGATSIASDEVALTGTVQPPELSPGISDPVWDANEAELTLTWGNYPAWAAAATNGLSGLTVEVENETAEDTSAPSAAVNTEKTGATVTGLTLGNTYTFNVFAYVGEETNNAKIGTKENYVVPDAPGAPTVAAVSAAPAGGNTATVTWTMTGGVDSADGYKVYAAAADGWATAKEVTVTGNTPVATTVEGLTANVPYTFYVTTDKESTKPTESTGLTASAPLTLYAPIMTDAAFGDDLKSIDFTWTIAGEPNDVTGYSVYMGTTSDVSLTGTPIETAAKGATTATATLPTALDAGADYYFAVVSNFGTPAKQGALGEVFEATTAAAPAPITLAAAPDTDKITLAWDDAALTTGETFQVKRRIDLDGKTLEPIATIAVAGLGEVFEDGTYTYDDDTAVPGVPYRYQVVRVGADTTTSNEAGPVTISVTLGDMNVEVDPDAAMVDGFFVEWDSAGNAVAKYRVEYSKLPNGDWIPATTITADANGMSAVVKPQDADYNATYLIRVVPIFMDGTTEVAGEAQQADSAEALKPLPLEVTATFDGDKVNVSWTWEPGSVSGINFTIYREEVVDTTARRFSLFASAIAESGGLVTVGTAEGTSSYADTTIERGKTYRYTVVPDGGVGKSSMPSAAVTTTYAAPPKPTNLLISPVTDSLTSLKLTWTPPTLTGTENPTHYELTRSYGTSSGTMVTDQIAIAANEYTDTGVVPGTTFTYTLRSYYTDGTTGDKVYSDAPHATATYMIALPTSPVVTATTQTDDILLSWTGGDAFGAERFYIFAKKASEATGTWAIADSDLLVYVDGDKSSTTLKAGDGTSTNKLEAGVAYVFVVLPGYTFEGNMRVIPITPYPQATATVPTPSTTDPFNLKAVVSGNQVTLTWTVPTLTGATNLQVMRRNQAGTETQVGNLLAANANMTIDTNVPLGTYTYYVQALPTTLAMKSHEVTATVTGTTPTGDRPTNVQVKATAIDTIHVTWTAATGVTDYSIERSTAQDTGYAQVGTVTGGATTYDDKTVTPNTLYYYRVIGVLAGGNTAASDAAVGFVPLTLRNVVTATRDGSKIKLEWAYPQFATHVTIERATKEEGPYENHALVTAGATASPGATATATPTAWPWPTSSPGWNWGGSTTTIATSYTDELNVKSGTTYYYRVTPVYASGDKTIIGIPGEASAKSGGSGSGSTGGMTAKRSGYTTVALTWNESSSATGYAIERSIGSGEFSEIGTSQTASYADENALPTPEQIRYRVIPFTGDGEQRRMGSVSGTATVANELSAVGGIRAADDTSGAGTMLSWNAVGGATEYHIYARGNDSSPWQMMGVTFGNASTSFFNQGQQVSGAYRYYVEAVSRPAHASSATYTAAAQAGAALSRRPDGSWLLEYQAGGQVGSVPFTASDAQGQAAIALSYSGGAFTLSGMGAGSASTPDTVAVWPLEGADIIEPNIRFSKASSIVP